MDTLEKIAADIEKYCQKNGISVSKFGVDTVNNSHLYFNIKDGKQVTLKTMHRIYERIAADE
jgi:hypothetical protein